ncbi:hypothetical protein SERLA73DRAFT_188940 [Serpula lacrymans var. lacrymans S7.3]|uniref:DUF6534 domain-containing protein n=2 Tax=Serpula lacrymans var. lacrymans TaxID=341189 RepID=F8QCG5_SERL3|nr:uncharacterized protein SERLADRAFT_479557 [Serpula lacrymans var. lacrymans S7.9]EGN93830.1 hypothetical protein SERLA73DRAFT_188940 [Serpula lacrymans var. lacrymans S7.3]EGO19199.1 hypothetical protein SERLADRAFT_479557 [Serpula lacrymans var. lacrymans S7.9]
MTTPFTLPPNTKFDSTLGALLVGLAVSAVAYGVFSVQVYTYYRRYPSDKAFYKTIVVLIWILETADEAFIGHCVYYYLVTNFVDPSVLFTAKPVWTLVLQVAFGALVGCIVKVCFALRVWRFSYRNWFLTGSLVLLTLAQMGLAIAYTIRGFQITTLLDLTGLRVVGSLALGFGVATDMSIAAALCYYLQGMRSGYSGSDSLVNTLTIYAVNTGVLTSACSIVTLILYDCMTDNFIFMCFYFVLSKLYAISFMATMNTRKAIRGRGTDREEGKSTSFIMVSEAAHRHGSVRMPAAPPQSRRKVNSVHSDYSPSASGHYTDGW